jgi:hypothetical protein
VSSIAFLIGFLFNPGLIFYYNHATAYVCYLFGGIGYACYSLSFWNLAMYFVKLYLNKVEILKKIRPISKGKKAKIAKEVQPTQPEE